MRSLLVLIVVLATVGPVVAAALPAPAGERVVVLLDRQGQTHVLPGSSWDPDAFSACGGDAPFDNGCTLTDCCSFNYLVGWDVPGSWLGTPVGSVAMSTHFLMTASYGGVVEFECDWGVNPAGVLVPGMLRCALLQYSGNVWGTLTVRFHTGVLDPHVLSLGFPSTNDVEAGLGNWRGVLYDF